MTQPSTPRAGSPGECSSMARGAGSMARGAGSMARGAGSTRERDRIARAGGMASGASSTRERSRMARTGVALALSLLGAGVPGSAAAAEAQVEAVAPQRAPVLAAAGGERLELALRNIPANELPDIPEPPGRVAPPVAPTQLKIELPNGSSMRFGMLWQARFEQRGAPEGDGESKNFFLRRFAILIGGTVLHDLEYFFDTDFGDLFKATGPDATKAGPDIVTKDALVTYRALGDTLKIDAGLMLPAGARNTLVGGGGLLGLDFFRNAFRHAGAFGTTSNTFGRDLGVQLRGLVAGLLEYRLGAFQGRRSAPVEGPPARASARNSFRFAGRLQLSLLDPETTFFYAGTYLGKKSVLSLGVSLDYQHEDTASYLAYAADAALDVPLGPGGLSAEIDVVHRDGGAIAALPRQTALEAEAGYRIEPLKLSPVVHYERRWMSEGTGGETDIGAGLAFWAYGHTSNLKAFYDRIRMDDSGLAYHELNLQWQLAFY